MTPANKNENAAPIVLGRVSGLYGVKGWVKVFSYTDPREAILEYSDCLLSIGGEWLPARIAEGRKHGKSIIARLDDTEDRDAAKELIGAEIAVQREALPEIESGQYYWADLEGLTVVHRDGRMLGKVAYLMATGTHDVMVVRGEQETLIPFVPERFVLEVNLAESKIRVDWEWD